MNPYIMRYAILGILILVMFATNGGLKMETIVFGLPSVLIAITLHEFAHAFIADKLGDPTPRMQGRVTIDIRKHVDPWGLLALWLIGFGWGRPVQTDARYLKNHKRDMALIAAAGPFINMIISIISVVVLVKSGLYLQTGTNKAAILVLYIALYNASFAVFNLLPIPGFDGSRIVGFFLTNKAFYKYMEIEYKYQIQIYIGLFILLSTNILSGPLSFMRTLILNIGLIISNLLPF